MSEDHAELARSILACPASPPDVAVDGFPTVGDDDDLGLRDQDGTPTFSCRTWLADGPRRSGRQPRAAHPDQRARPGADRTGRVTLTLTGRPRTHGRRELRSAAASVRHEVGARPRLRGRSTAGRATRCGCRCARSGSPELRLNRGYLQRALEHANDCHREDLGQVVSRMTGTTTEHLLDVGLADLTTHGAELGWIDADGGHRAALWFSRPARTVEELGVLLRRELHAGIC